MSEAHQETVYSGVPTIGYLRLRHIIGDKKANPPILPLIPVSAAHWWSKVKKGDWPQPIKLSGNITVWKTQEIKKLLESFADDEAVT